MNTTIQFIRRSVLTAAILGFTATYSHGALVSWGAATDIASDSDVSTVGTLAAAVNFGPAGVAGTTINGVTFTPFPLAGGITTTTSQPFSSDYLTLLNSALRLPADTPVTLSFVGLTIGQNYLFQAWVNNSGRNFSLFSRGDFPTTASDGLGNNVNLYPGDNGIGMGPGGTDVPPAPGQYVIGTFTADATSQDFNFISGEIDGVLNGIQLRQLVTPIPEPSTWTFGIALCLPPLLVVRRRSRA